MNPNVLLVCMPWNLATRPSVSLGILQSVLDREGVPSEVLSLHLAFAEHVIAGLAARGEVISLERFEHLANDITPLGGGDWAFCVPPYRDPDAAADAAYLARLTEQARAEDAELLGRVRELVPAFLDQCCDEILRRQPRVVGFTTTFCQNVPSLALARMIKQRDPSIAVVFGGSNCEGPMGEALHAAFPWVDVVVRGEGERVLPRLVGELLAGEPVSAQPGLCVRRDGRVTVEPEASATVAMDDVPMPRYDEYFERVARSALADELRPLVKIPYETARGCWWGAKHHCTFCGLNGATMRFRSKSPGRVVEEVRELARRYECLDFYVVDNIIDMDYFQTVLPALRDAGWDLALFFETKSNLRREQVRMLRDAGVRLIQPGIESLSTPILDLMRKGVTALHNVRLLKWCAEHDISVFWNIIYGFPGEPPEAYAAMAHDMQSLTHLAAPNATRLRIDRFSPYFEQPASLGLRVTGPLWFYRYVYDVPAPTLAQLAYFFDAETVEPAPADDYTAAAREVAAAWKRDTRSSYRSLSYRVGPDLVLISDQRPGIGPARYVLEREEAAIYLAIDAGATPRAVVRSLRAQYDDVPAEEEVRAFLDELVEARLVYREGDRYLSLALAEDPDRLAVAAAQVRERVEPAARAELVSLRLPGEGARAHP